MKFFLSRRNRLLVSAPGVSYPVPKCGDVMCPVVVFETFPCPPQLDPAEGTVSFTVVPVAAEPPYEEVIGANYEDDSWVKGDGPDGMPLGTSQFYVYSGPDLFYVSWGDSSPYELITLSVLNSRGATVVDNTIMAFDSDSNAFIVDETPEHPRLNGDERYCVKMDFTPKPEVMFDIQFTPVHVGDGAAGNGPIFLFNIEDGIANYGDLESVDPAEHQAELGMYVTVYPSVATYFYLWQASAEALATWGDPPWEARMYEGSTLIGAASVPGLASTDGIWIDGQTSSTPSDISIRLVRTP